MRALDLDGTLSYLTQGIQYLSAIAIGEKSTKYSLHHLIIKWLDIQKRVIFIEVAFIWRWRKLQGETVQSVNHCFISSAAEQLSSVICALIINKCMVFASNHAYSFMCSSVEADWWLWTGHASFVLQYGRQTDKGERVSHHCVHVVLFHCGLSVKPGVHLMMWVCFWSDSWAAGPTYRARANLRFVGCFLSSSVKKKKKKWG